jgi:hypothetical protein
MTTLKAASPEIASLSAAPSLNRTIRIASGEGVVRAALEDDFHHFLVEIEHRDGVVTAARSKSPRFPYSLCPAAGDRLAALVGASIHDRIVQVQAHADARYQCTHQYELAVLAVSAAGRGVGARVYRAVVADRDAQPQTAMLERDGEVVLRWTLSDYAVAAPAPYAGVALGAGFSAWVSRTLDEAEAEAALVLRRAVFISSGRGMAARLDAMAHASIRGGCWVQQPERARDALRQRGSTLDFAGRSHLLTADDDPWLAGAIV